MAAAETGATTTVTAGNINNASANWSTASTASSDGDGGGGFFAGEF